MKTRLRKMIVLFVVMAVFLGVAGFAVGCGASDDSSSAPSAVETPNDDSDESDTDTDDDDDNDEGDDDDDDAPSDESELQHTHTVKVHAAVPADCTTDGNIYYIECEDCGKLYSDEDCTEEITEYVIPSNGHRYSESIIPPTCTTDGYTEHVCGVCGDTYIDSETDKLDHDISENITQQATCTQTGIRTFSCSRCEYSVAEDIPANGHDYSASVVPPTCTEGGYTLHTCSACGDEYTDTATGATGHSYNEEWSTDDTSHWHEVVCGCDVEAEKSAHVYNDFVCECGHSVQYLLQFELDEEKEEYTVTGIVVAEDVADCALDVVIPSEYNGLPVTVIAEKAFMSNNKLKSIYIPESIKRIGKNAFWDSSLTEAVFESAAVWKMNNNSSNTVTPGDVKNNAILLKDNNRLYTWYKK